MLESFRSACRARPCRPGSSGAWPGARPGSAAGDRDSGRRPREGRSPTGGLLSEPDREATGAPAASLRRRSSSSLIERAIASPRAVPPNGVMCSKPLGFARSWSSVIGTATRACVEKGHHPDPKTAGEIADERRPPPARRRVGSAATSFATIEPEVSITRTTVACSRGTLRATAGRAIPISAKATASAKTSGGMKRRFCAVPLFGSTEREHVQVREADGVAGTAPLDEHIGEQRERDQEESDERYRPLEPHLAELPCAEDVDLHLDRDPRREGRRGSP